MAQNYNEAAIVSRKHNGCKNEVSFEFENAIFVHYYKHRVNLALVQLAECIKKFLDTSLIVFILFKIIHTRTCI